MSPAEQEAGHAVPTPASRHPRPTVAVLGAGVAGLTAAHELADRGFAVTVYEPRADERAERGGETGRFPPVKLGGLAASQFSTTGSGGRPAELRPFPGRRGSPATPAGRVPGEHGFRFFPAYYLHIWDLFQRIPLYEPSADGERGRPSARTVMDNVRRVVTQGTTVEGRPSLVFPREAPRTAAEMLTTLSQLTDLGYTVDDLQTFGGRLLRYLTTSPLRRATELQNLSAYDFFVGADDAGSRRFGYSPRFEALVLEMPRILAAFDSRWGDARTNLTTFLQLQLHMGRHDNKADGVLNGPTTEAWFDHWYRHLTEIGVAFVRGAAVRLEPPADDRTRPAHLRPRVGVVLDDGTTSRPDYVVVAVDAPGAERITTALRAAGTGGAVAGLEGFTTSAAPPDGPLQPRESRPSPPRDPYVMDELGRVPWDRFQTIAGIQYYFDTEFQLLRGHMYYSGTEWGLSSINHSGLWERRPVLAHDGHGSVLSVDIGDFNTPTQHVLDEFGRGKAARDCTPDELAGEVWRQIVSTLTSDADTAAEAIVPWPVWYALDRNLVTSEDDGRIVRNEAPYLVPIVGDWPNRPDGEPWNPHGTSWTSRPTEQRWNEDLEQRGVWQARHGGYQVHHNSVVFAGTWTRTFTRMTSMEAACESARHAVNAMLDHYVWVETGGADRRERTTLDWRFPFDFLDQGFSSPVRLPSPAGDYCYVFDIENREPLDTRGLRMLDSQRCLASQPHLLDVTEPTGGLGAPSVPPSPGEIPMSAPNDYTGQLLAHLQAWRQYLEQAVSGGASPVPPPVPPTAAWPAPPAPGTAVPWPPPMPPSAPGAGRAAPGPESYPDPPPDPPRRGTDTVEASDVDAGHRPGQQSRYDTSRTTPPSGPPRGRPPGTAYASAQEPLAPNPARAPEPRSLYSHSATSPSGREPGPAVRPDRPASQTRDERRQRRPAAGPSASSGDTEMVVPDLKPGRR